MPEHKSPKSGEIKCSYDVSEHFESLNDNFIKFTVESSKNFSDMKIKINEVKESVEKVSDIILDPEKGLYTRLKFIENWRSNLIKIFWVLLASGAGLFLTKYLLGHF